MENRLTKENLYDDLSSTYVALKKKIILKSDELSKWSFSEITKLLNDNVSFEETLKQPISFTKNSYEIPVSYKNIFETALIVLELGKTVNFIYNHSTAFIDGDKHVYSELHDFWKGDHSLNTIDIVKTDDGVGFTTDFKIFCQSRIPKIDRTTSFNKEWVKSSVVHLNEKCCSLLKIVKNQINEFARKFIKGFSRLIKSTKDDKITPLLKYKNLYKVINFLWLTFESMITMLTYVMITIRTVVTNIVKTDYNTDESV